MYKKIYNSPLGEMVMYSDGEYLRGLIFKKSKDYLKFDFNCEYKDLDVFNDTKRWLDIYFSGNIPDFMPKYKVDGTDFRLEVNNIIKNIPYGKVITYNDIAKEIAAKRNIKRMSAQAVCGAVGWNPICIIIPCHRVVGANNNLVGYGGGINNKIKLLELEGIDFSKYYYVDEKF